jgi:hypothetical protein
MTIDNAAIPALIALMPLRRQWPRAGCGLCQLLSAALMPPVSVPAVTVMIVACLLVGAFRHHQMTIDRIGDVECCGAQVPGAPCPGAGGSPCREPWLPSPAHAFDHADAALEMDDDQAVVAGVVVLQ